MKLLMFHVACIVLFIVPLIFVYNQVYRDGIVGRLFLLGISGTAALFLLDWLDGVDGMFDPPRLAVAMVAMFAGFLVWHLWRFHRRVLKRDDVKYPPNCPQDRRREPERRFRTQ